MDSVGLLTQTGIKVGLGVFLAITAAAVACRFHWAVRGSRAQAGSLRVVDTAALGQNRAVHLIVVGRRALLIGSTPGQIALLADVTGDRDPAQEPDDGQPAQLLNPRAAFTAVLSRLLKSPGSTSRDDRAERLRTAAQALRAASARSSHA